MADIIIDNAIVEQVLYMAAWSWFLWVPPILFIIFKYFWRKYVSAGFMSKWKWTLVEIKIPREVAKSPKAMENILAVMHGSRRMGNLLERYWDGWTTAYFSLEIVGNETGVHFYVWTLEFFRRMIESQIYAQYPSAEIKVVEDYTKNMPEAMPNDEWTLWGSEFVLTKPDAYPIRTYEDFTLEGISSKEEERKIDPLSALIEFLGSLKGREKVWIQMVIQPSDDRWKKEGERLIAKILGKEVKSKPGIILRIMESVSGMINTLLGVSSGEKKSDNSSFKMLMLSPGEKDAVEALERNISKLGFDVGIRWMYVVPRAEFDYMAVPAVIGIFKQFSSQTLNGFKSNGRVSTSVDYWFEKTRTYWRMVRLFNAYRLRAMFHAPYNRRSKSFVLSTEELATIYHFPGMVAGAPSMERVEAKKGSPPANLPV